MNCPLPPNKIGRHVIYAIWQRDDSPEAFYSCSDVVLGNDTITDWKEIGRIRGRQGQLVGSQVVFRLFDSAFQDVETHRITLLEGMNTGDAWPFHLAQKVNSDSQIVNIGVLDDSGNIVPIRNVAGNRVYVQSDSEFSFETDFEIPKNDDDDSGLEEWDANATYVFGDSVSHDGTTYRAKWWSRGDEPISNPTVPWETPWEVVHGDPRGDPSEPELDAWHSTATYVAGDVVLHENSQYKAKWWNQNFSPSTPVNNSWETPWKRLP